MKLLTALIESRSSSKVCHVENNVNKVTSTYQEKCNSSAPSHITFFARLASNGTFDFGTRIDHVTKHYPFSVAELRAEPIFLNLKLLTVGPAGDAGRASSHITIKYL